MAGIISSPLITTVRKTLMEMNVSPDSKILAGVSGGVDSMVMISVLKNLGFAIAAAHVNFQLRGNESDEDAGLVSKWCKENGVPYFDHVVDTKKYSEDNKLNIQTAARQLRYQWWDGHLKAGYFDFVAIAHQKDDDIETIFLNLLRGTGIKGLSGIPAKRDHFIRPLIHVSRATIELYAAENKIPFRTDSSNESDDYMRNRVRHHLIPVARELTDQTDSWMDHTLARIKLEWKAWEQAFQNWQSMNVTQKEKAYFLKAADTEQPYLLRWLEEKGIPWPLAFDYVSATKAEKGKPLDHNGMRLSRTKDGYYLGKIKSLEPVVIDKPGIYKIGEDEFSIEVVTPDQFTKNNDPDTEFMNKDAVQWPLQIRQVLPGDHFQPLGMEGQTKTLQDFLVNLKLDHFEKRNIRLLLSGEQVLWVIGKRLDERVKVDEKSPGEIYKITFKES